jgi:hypothetical protein
MSCGGSHTWFDYTSKKGTPSQMTLHGRYCDCFLHWNGWNISGTPQGCSDSDSDSTLRHSDSDSDTETQTQTAQTQTQTQILRLRLRPLRLRLRLIETLMTVQNYCGLCLLKHFVAASLAPIQTKHSPNTFSLQLETKRLKTRSVPPKQTPLVVPLHLL